MGSVSTGTKKYIAIVAVAGVGGFLHLDQHELADKNHALKFISLYKEIYGHSDAAVLLLEIKGEAQVTNLKLPLQTIAKK